MPAIDVRKIPITDIRDIPTTDEPSPPPARAAAPSGQRTNYDWSAIPQDVLLSLIRGMTSGTLGLPANMLNLPGAVSGIVGGPKLSHVPLDTEWWNTLLTKAGYPEPQGTMGKIASTAGEFVGPGMALKTTEKVLGGLPSLVAKIKPLVTAGTKGDVAMGTVAGGGGEVGAYYEGKSGTGQESGVGRTVGQAIGALSAAAGHAGASRVVRWLGKEIVVGQDIAEAVSALHAAQDALKTGAKGAAEQLAMEVERARQLHELHTARVSGVQTAEVDPAIEFLAQTTQRAEQDLAQAKARTGVQVAWAEAAHGQTERALQDARQGQQQAFDPLASEVTAAVGTVLPSEKAAGTVTKGAAETTAATRTAAPLEAYKQLRDDIAPAIGRDAMASRAQREVLPVFENKKRLVGEMFDVSEHLAGDDGPVVEHFFQVIKDAQAEVDKTGQALPRGTGAMRRTAGGKESSLEEINLLKEKVLGDPKLTGAQREEALNVLTAMEDQGGAGAIKVPFWLSRRMESALNEMQRGGLPIGTQLEGRIRHMLGALRDDIYPWLQEHYPNEAKELRAAKDAWIELLHTYNYSANRFLLDTSAKANPAQWFDALLKSSARGTDDLVLAKHVLEPATWETLKSSILQHLFDQATRGTGAESVSQLHSVARNLQRNGKLAILLDGAGEKERFLGILQDISAGQKGPESTLAKALATRTPEQVSAYVFQPGNVGRTEAYKRITDTARYDTQVKAWIGSMAESLRDLSPEQIATKLRPYARRNQGELSQLDVMLEQYPGASDRITALVDAHRQYGQQLPSLKELEAGARDRLAGTRTQRGQAETLTKEAGTLDIAQAQAQLTQAQERLAQAQTAQQASQTITGQTQETIKAANDAILRPYHEAVDQAQTALRDLRQKSGLPEEGMQHLYGRAHFGLGVVARMPVGAMGVLSVLEGLARQQPVHIAVGLGAMAFGYGFEPWAHTTRGRAAIRGGFPNRWSAAAGRFAAGVLGAQHKPTLTLEETDRSYAPLPSP